MGKAKQWEVVNEFLAGQMLSQFQESKASSCVMATWEDMHHTSRCPPAFIVEHDAKWYGISFWSSGVSQPGSVLSPVMRSLLAGQRGRKGLDAV